MTTNLLYPSILDTLLTGGLDVTTAPLAARLTDGYTPDAGHTNISDVGAAVVAEEVTLTGVTVAGGQVAADPAVFTTLATGTSADGLVIYVAATGQLVAFIGQRADFTPLAFAGNDQPVTLTFTKVIAI